jgi:hypothetical protein
MLNNTLRARAVGAGTASRDGSGSDQIMRLRLWLRNTVPNFTIVGVNTEILLIELF